MILPTKHLDTHRSLIGLGASVLDALDRPRPLSTVWEHIRQRPEMITFERFTLAICFLYAIGAVEMEEGRLRRT